jgi:hypothetical protein
MIDGNYASVNLRPRFRILYRAFFRIAVTKVSSTGVMVSFDILYNIGRLPVDLFDDSASIPVGLSPAGPDEPLGAEKKKSQVL